MKKFLLALLVGVMCIGATAQTVKISQLPAVTSFTVIDSLLYPVVQNGVTKKMYGYQLVSAIQNAFTRDDVAGGIGITIDSIVPHSFTINIDTTIFHTSAYNDAQIANLIGGSWSTTSQNSAGSEFNLSGGSYVFKNGGSVVGIIGGSTGTSGYIGRIVLGNNASANGPSNVVIGRNATSSVDSSIVLGTEASNSVKRTLYITDYIKKFHLKLDSLPGTAPNVIARNANGDWGVYALPSAGGSDNLNDVTARDSTTTHSITVTGDTKNISVNGATTGGAGIGTVSGNGYLYVYNSVGKYFRIFGDSITSSRNYQAPNESGELAIKKYKEYVATIFPQDSNDPIVSVISSEIGTITWSYISPGNFQATCSGCFVENKVFATYTAGEITGDPPVFGFYGLDANTTYTQIYSPLAATTVDGAVSSFQVSFRVYK